MDTTSNAEDKPERLYFDTYLEMLRNSIGTRLFRTIYVKMPSRGEFDALDGGKNSCAFFVSAVLTLMKKGRGIHGTIASTRRDLEDSGWQVVGKGTMQKGDVLIWEAMQAEDGFHEHIGFYLGDDRAVSTSSAKLEVVEHDIHFGKTNRKITQVYRMKDW